MIEFGRGIPAYGTINPAMAFYYDEGLAETSQQTYDLEAAQQLLADAGFPNGEGFPTLRLAVTPGGRREAQVLADILNRSLNITVELDTKDFPVLIDEFDRMEFDLLRVGSGGDFDPDDGLIDWMSTTSRFNGRERDQSVHPFGFWSEDEADAAIADQSVAADLETRRELVQAANAITSNKLASVFLFHPVDALVHRTEVNFPAVSRIPGLVDLDRVSLS